MTDDQVATKGWLQTWMEALAVKMKNEIRLPGDCSYAIVARAGRGPIVYVTFEGASDDTSMLKSIRPQLEEILRVSMKEATEVPGFDARISSYNKGDDLEVCCEIIFPDGE